jgi:HEAT repeat protein
MIMRFISKVGLFLFVIAVCLSYGGKGLASMLRGLPQTQTPSVQTFFQQLVDHYNPASMPTLADLMRVVGEIAAASPDEIRKALPAIFAALAHQDDAVKHRACTALFEIARRSDGPSLLKSHINDIGEVLLNSPNPDTRNGSLVILGTLSPPPVEVVPIFLSFLKRTDAEAQAQQGGIIFQLIQIDPDSPEILAAIREFLSRTLDNNTRIGVLNALGNPKIKDVRLIAIMIASLDDPDPGIRSTAIQSLGRIGPKALLQGESNLQRLATDLNQPADVTNAAKAALQRIHPE